MMASTWCRFVLVDIIFASCYFPTADQTSHRNMLAKLSDSVLLPTHAITPHILAKVGPGVKLFSDSLRLIDIYYLVLMLKIMRGTRSKYKLQKK